MREKIVPSAWLEKEGRRLDCGPYLSGAIETRLLLDQVRATFGYSVAGGAAERCGDAWRHLQCRVGANTGANSGYGNNGKLYA